MRLQALPSGLALASTVLASAPNLQNDPNLLYDAQSLISVYVPTSVYAQLTASVASAASAAQVTGDPASLFLSVLLDTTKPAWFTSAVPPYFTSNIGALESAVSTLRDSVTTSYSETVVVTRTTDSQGSTVTTSFTSSVPQTSSSSTNGAMPTAADQYRAGFGAAALAVGLAAVL